MNKTFLKTMLTALVITAAGQAFAGGGEIGSATLGQQNGFNCVDSISGADAGKIVALTPLVNGDRISYSSNRASSEGWTLLVANNGTLYNADPMVKNGKDLIVGKMEMKSFYYSVEINGKKMICD